MCTGLFGGQTTDTTRDTRRGTLAPGLQEAQKSSLSDFNVNRQSANVRGIENNRGSGSVVSTPEGDIRITSVIETNSLLIQATQSQYSSIQAAIERIDQEPLQVLIEAQILDVELNEDLQFGVNWFLTNNPDAIAPGGESPINAGFDTLAFGATNNFFANIVGPVGNAFMQATISALDSVTDVRSLGAPSLLVRNNATATITVGTQVPVQSSSISTGNPPINNKSVTSQVAVQSGQTIFLGGLISEQTSKGRTIESTSDLEVVSDDIRT